MKCHDYSAGMLREPIALQREVSAEDSMGGQVKEFKTYANTKAHVKPLSGRERVFGMQLEGSITHKVIVRYNASIKEKDRILLRGEPLQIRAVLNIEMRNLWLELSCEQGVAT